MPSFSRFFAQSSGLHSSIELETQKYHLLYVVACTVRAAIGAVNVYLEIYYFVTVELTHDYRK